ncbi:MAG: hypothetical protein HY907_11950 [Deltaproteobacteria bacterium]|nr:hypothetical protein [Deltaproteobacteria bacterium]
MSLRSLCTSVFLLLPAVVASPSAAQEFPDNPLIQAGINQYNDMEYETSADTLQRALVRAENVPDQKIAIFKFLALDYLVLGRMDDAQQAFRQLLAIQPEFQLDPALFAPGYVQFLEGVRQQWEDEGRPGWVPPEQLLHPATLDHDLPAEAPSGESLDVAVRLDDPDHRVRAIVLAYRPAGETGFVRVETAPAAQGFGATIPGDQIGPPVVEYFFEALDERGSVVGRNGDERIPLRVPVRGEGEGSIWSSWWFWTLIGVGVAAAVAIPVGIVYGGDDAGGPATVTVILCQDGVDCP